MIKGATTAPIPARNVHMPLTGVIKVLTKLLNLSRSEYGGIIVSVKFDDSGRLMLLLLEKISPSLLVMVVGKDMFAFIRRITGVGASTFVLPRTLMWRVEVPDDEDGIDVLLGIKLVDTSLRTLSIERDQLSKISIPTLVITGTEDIAAPADNSLIIAQKIPGAWLVQIKGAGHGLMYQYPEKLSTVLKTFLTTTTIPSNWIIIRILENSRTAII
jgi:pimeloyl-ACP methyl ester carboxylesterase